MGSRVVRSVLLASLGVLCVAPAGPAQGLSDPGQAPLRAGRAALERGDPGGAVQHLLEAWVHRSGSPEILSLLLAASAADPDARALWGHAWAARHADAKGRFQVTGQFRVLLPQDDVQLARVAAARAAAVEELARLSAARRKRARKRSDELLVAAWAARLARELATASPALWSAYAADLPATLGEPLDAHAAVIDALQSVLSASFSKRRYGDAVLAARSLRGLARQAGLKDLQGPAPPGLDRLERSAAQALARARAALAEELGAPWSVEEFERLKHEQGQAFTRAHHTYGRPGIALSSTAMYRVETDCGYETLLGVARTIELHHGRLAGWYGEDPFVARQGICRIVPEAHGLESEGAPFWWAGGFQGGDVTTLRFSCGTIEGLDQPTWTWSRVRAEPSFGQDQARAAGELLHTLGREQAAAQALVWGLGADGRTPAVERRLAALLRELGRRDAAWTLAATLAFPAAGAPAPPPFRLARTKAYLAALRAAAEGYAADGRATAAAALGADHDRLAAHLGAAPLALGRPPARSLLHPFDPPAAGLGGWVEDGLTDYEELRRPGLWYAADDGTLHVGRKRPRAGTGTLDRSAHQRHAFTRANAWQMPGRYRLSCRVQLTTSFVSGAVVIGYTRRDRNVRLRFSAGDFLYSIGSSDEGQEIESVGWRIDGLRERDGALPGAHPRGTVEFGRPMSTFELELLVDGATLHVHINGERRGTYHTVDGAPIEGYVGFATSMGAMRIHRPVVQRLDRSDFAERAQGGVPEILLNHGLTWRGGSTQRRFNGRPEAAADRRFRGEREVPSNGMFFLRMAQPDDEEEGYAFDPERWVKRALRCITALGRLREKEGVLQPLTVALSQKLVGEPLAHIRGAVEEALGSVPELVLYPWIEPPPAEDPGAAKALDTNWLLLLLDPSGVIRVREAFFGWETELSPTMTHWQAVLRENGWPERELAPLERPVRAAEDDGDGE